MAGMYNTPPPEYNLFDINNNKQLLYKNTKKYFHMMAAKLMFVSKGAIPDLQGKVAFLTINPRGTTNTSTRNLHR